MSSSGQAASPTRVRTPFSRLGLVLLRVLLAIPVLGILFLALFAVRLCFGPVQIGWLTHRFAPDAIAGGQPRFDRMWLAWPQVGGPLAIGATDIGLRRPDGSSPVHAARAEIALALPSLLGGHIRPERVTIAGADISLEREADGHVRLAGSPERPARRSDDPSKGDTLTLDRLQHVALDDVTVSVADPKSHRQAAIHVETARLRPWGSLASGLLRAQLLIDGKRIAVQGQSAAAGQALQWHLGAGTVVPSDFAPILPALAGIGVPISPSADLRFDAQSSVPQSGQFSFDLGAGSVPAGAGTLPIQSGHGVIVASRQGADGIALVIRETVLALAAPAGASAPGPVFTATGQATLDHTADPRRIHTHLRIHSDRVDFNGLGRYWPAGIAPGGRRWVTENITQGVATNVQVESELASDSGWKAIREVKRIGSLDAHGLEMWWLRPMPPLRDTEARLTLQGTDGLLVQSPSAVLPVEAVGPEAKRLGGGAASQPLRVSDSTMRITGLDGDKQIGDVHIKLAGRLADLLCALAHPRLSLLSKHPVPFTDPKGQVQSDVSVRLPLDSNVAIEEVAVTTLSEMHDAHLGNVAGGIGLDHADLTVAADTNGLKLSGTAAAAGIPSQLQYQMDFTAGGPDQLVEQALVQGSPRASTLAALGLDAGDAVTGEGKLSVAYKARRDGLSRIELGLDMTGFAIALPVWSKRGGLPAHLDAVVHLNHGHLETVGPIHAEGPGLSVDGEVATPPTGPRRLTVHRFVVGRTQATGSVLFPHAGADKAKQPIRITAKGSALDLASLIDSPARKTAPPRSKAAPKPAAPGPAWIADLSFARVYVGQATSLGGVSAHVEHDGRSLVRANVDAADPTGLSVRLYPNGAGRGLDGRVADTGLLLRKFDLTDQVSGGVMTLTAQLPDPPENAGKAGAPMTGTVRIGRFVLPRAPLAARVARNISIYGWLLAPRSPELVVDSLEAPFSLNDEVLSLSNARAHSAALGLTMRGRVDLGRQKLDLDGTVVPAWIVNQLPGRIPLIGKLLVPEKGGGVVAVTVGLHGPFSNPKFDVNPLSVLAPGILRALLFK